MHPGAPLKAEEEKLKVQSPLGGGGQVPDPETRSILHEPRSDRHCVPRELLGGHQQRPRGIVCRQTPHGLHPALLVLPGVPVLLWEQP